MSLLSTIKFWVIGYPPVGNWDWRFERKCVMFDLITVYTLPRICKEREVSFEPVCLLHV